MSLDHATDFVKQSLTHDAFLGGRLTMAQPAKGFRAGLDSVLLGAAVTAASGTLLDLGAGAGTAAMVALTHRPALNAMLVENDTAMAALASANLADNGLAPRGKVLALDLTAAGPVRAKAGLLSDHFAAVIANPPFFAPRRGTAPSPGRAAARHMDDAALDLWVKAAATHAAPDGEIIFIYPAEALAPLLSAFARRFGAITLLPLCPREGEASTRILIRGIKGSRAPLTLLPSRALHAPEGRTFRPEFEAIFRGEDHLHW